MSQNNHNPFFSIVIPLYNAEKFISRCLDSCINQSFQDIEIIVVNDCGRDNSLAISQLYAKKDKRIKIFCNPHNFGTLKTRMIGGEHAKGLYTLFLDADDFLKLDACEIIHNAILSNQNIDEEITDICCFEMEYLLNERKKVVPTIASTCYKPNLLKIFFLIPKIPPWSIWGKAYKTSMLQQAQALMKRYICDLENFVMAEDVLHLFFILLIANKNIGINIPLYIYCDNQNSITRRTVSKDMLKKSEQIQKVVNIFYSLREYDLKQEQNFFLESLNRIICLLNYTIQIHNAHHNSFLAYPIAHIKSLRYKQTWKTYFRIILFFITFGKIKI